MFILIGLALAVGIDQWIRFGKFFEGEQYHHEDIMAFFVLMAFWILLITILVNRKVIRAERRR